jgi:hypothetical protein
VSEQEQSAATETTETAAATTEPRVAAGSGGDGPSGDLEKVRGLVLQAHPDVVPDLVRGASVDELIASVEPARAAYQAVADRVRAGGSTSGETGTGGEGGGSNGGASANGASASGANPAATPPAVPAGGAANVIDPASIPASEKIRRALEARSKR